MLSRSPIRSLRRIGKRIPERHRLDDELTTTMNELRMTKEAIEQTVPDRFEFIAARVPQRLALRGHGREWTYAQLNRDSNGIAHEIRRVAPAGHGRVASLVEQSPLMVLATLGTLKAGRTCTALHPSMPQAALRSIMADVRPDLLLTTVALERDARALAQGLCPVLVLERVRPEGAREDVNPQRNVTPRDASTLFYTSGSTGQPKGVIKSHRAVLHRVWLSAQHDAITVDDRQSLLTHCSFSASESDLFGALLQGAAVCTFDLASRGFAEFRQWLESEAITLLHPPVLFFRRFLSTLEPHQRFPFVRLVALAGDVVLPEDVRRWRQHASPECVVLHRFSITETAMLTVARFDSEVDLSPEVLEAGSPVEGKTLRLIDREGAPVRHGETGELLVESEYLADGYWNRSEETAMKFSDGPDGRTRMYRTGDLGRFTDDGAFVFAGRADHQLKIRGYRVELREIDAALMQLDAVKEAACVARHDQGEQRLTAFVVWHDGRSCSVSELRARLRDRLPEWKIPDQFHSVAVLPSTLNGKVDRQQLSAQIAHAAPLQEAAGTLTDQDERTSGSRRVILAIWERVLRTSVRLDDTFFDDLGGSSLDALAIVDAIHQQTGRRLPLSLLMELNSVRKLADYLDAVPDRERILIAVQRAGRRPPVFCVSGKGGSVMPLRGLADRLGSDQPFFGLSYHGFAPETRPSTLAALAACYVDAIREQQPDGPYALAGFSAGGLIAFEVARQLASAGQAIAFLAMLDTSASTLQAPRWKRARRFIPILRRRPAAFLARVARSLARRVLRVREVLGRGPSPSVPPLAENRYYESLQLLSSVQPWAHPVTLFLAREGVGATCALPDAGWSRLCGSAVEIIPVDGEHTTILHEDLDGLAHAFADALARARRRMIRADRSVGEISPESEG